MNTVLLIALLAGVALLIALVLSSQRRGEAPAALPSTPIDPPRSLMEHQDTSLEMLNRLHEGVCLVDVTLRPIFANPPAHAMLGIDESAGTPAKLPSVEISALARKTLSAGEEAEAQVDIFYPKRASLHVRVTQVADGDGALIVMRDITEEIHIQRVRKEFVTHASHELKSPVASLRTVTDALKQAIEAGDAPQAERFTNALTDDLERMSALVEDLLDLSRVEDPAALPVGTCDVGAVVNEELSALARSIEDNDLHLRMSIDPLLEIKGDPRQIGLMVRNLVRNAIRYTPDGGHIDVTAARAGTEVIIRVTDDGIGIPQESQPRLFERFYRVDQARARAHGGTGLGLAIVKHVAESHGGSVGVSSQLGEGSTFTVRLPLRNESSNGEPQVSQAHEESA